MLPKRCVLCKQFILTFGPSKIIDQTGREKRMSKLKQSVKQVFRFLNIDLTRNMKYDRQTSRVIKKVLRPGSGTIDVGCHKGEMLSAFLQLAPRGNHFAFEPIPDFYTALKKNFDNTHCHIFPYALAEKSGTTTFNYVKNAPAYSGLKQRKYAIEKPEIEELQVEIKTLDEIIPANEKIDLIKIDVEGAELGVIKGGIQTLLRNKPVVIFECGLGASDFYGTQPQDVYDILTQTAQLKLSTMAGWLAHQTPFTREEFCRVYESGKDYYFMAYP